MAGPGLTRQQPDQQPQTSPQRPAKNMAKKQEEGNASPRKGPSGHGTSWSKEAPYSRLMHAPRKIRAPVAMMACVEAVYSGQRFGPHPLLAHGREGAPPPRAYPRDVEERQAPFPLPAAAVTQ